MCSIKKYFKEYFTKSMKKASIAWLGYASNQK